MFDATFWALVSLIIFFAVIVYYKVPGMVTKALDERSDKIRNELEEARKLREEAQAQLAEYQRRRQEAEKEASEIVDAAKREAETITKEAREKTEEYVSRRTAMAEQKIAQAETDAMHDVRDRAVELALAAAEQIIGSKVTARSGGNELFKESVDAVKTRMN